MNASSTAAPESTYARFEQLMRDRYTVGQLINVTPIEFERTLTDLIGVDDPGIEGYAYPSAQRDFSVRFRWGHHHDFGSFELRGEMENRHLWLLSTFCDQFHALGPSLDGRRVLDVGPWTGGTSLLLTALGAQVTAIEEVRKYAQVLTYLAHAFDVKQLSVVHKSLFECTSPEFQDAFDLVLFAGVLYHVTDPLLALRHTFNALRDGGMCLIETYAIDSPEPIMRYEGARIVGPGRADLRNRNGWNWFRPSPEALRAMLEDVGYVDIQLVPLTPDSRLLAVAKREKHRDILRAGLSVPGVR